MAHQQQTPFNEDSIHAMTLAPGTSFGSYEVVEQIGSGGMGEVYRAVDAKLERDVAVKVLPESFVSDASRVARFLQEAKTLAALNHTNIAQVYGLEHSDGNAAIVMELVEGPTLADRIAEGPIPADEAIGIAMQIAAALDAAHGQGIVHRDLKPANVKLKPDGTVKVLDFGIAKPLSPELATSGGQSPIMTTPVTQVGVILGTAAYMSPEQARGKPVDQRTDVWAFGCVLYEMLTGQPAFGGEDVAVTLARVIANDTQLDSLPAIVSPAVRHTIALCLEKDPAKRIADIRDVRLALEGRFEAPLAQVAAESGRSARRLLPVAAAALVVGAIAAGLGAWTLKPEPAPEPRRVVRGTHFLPEGVNFRGQTSRMVAISPDGRRFVYNGTGGLYLRPLDAMDAILIPGTAAAVHPVFSPDGNSLLVFQGDQLRRLSVSGGPSLAIAPATAALGSSWENDGKILYVSGGGIYEVSENGGESKLVVPIDEGIFISPQRLPGGDWILFTWARAALTSRLRLEDSEIVVASPSLGEQRVVRQGGMTALYLPTGHLVYAFDGVLYAVPFDVDRLEETGGPVPVVEGVLQSVTGVAQFDVSDAGDLIYIPGPVSSSGVDYSLVSTDSRGSVTTIGDTSGPYEHVRASRDGRWAALWSDNGDESIIYVLDLHGTSAPRRLSFGGTNAYPVWSPDGKRIAFQSDREGDKAMWVQPADGTGPAERLTMPGDGEAHIPEDWSPDGRHVLFSIDAPDSPLTLWSLSVEDGQIERVDDIESLEPIGASFSPDGKWIAFHSLPTVGSELATNSGVFIEPFPPTGARYQLPKIERDFQPVWSRSDMVLYYVGSTASGQLVSVDVETANGVSFENTTSFPFTLTAGRLSGATRGFDVLPDGRFIGLVSGTNSPGNGVPTEVRYILNWFDELERLVPTE